MIEVLSVGLISFAAIFGGVVIGMFAARRLPSHHLDSQTQSVVTVSVAVIGTLSALVLGLMITAANRSFTERSDKVRMLSLDFIRIDRNLRRYGPEAEDGRTKLRLLVIAKTQELFPEQGQPAPSQELTVKMLEDVQHALLILTPKDEEQKYLRTLCITLTSNMVELRWALEQQSEHSIPTPFLVLLIFWLAIVFTSFALFASAKPAAIVALFLCSVAVSAGIALITDLDSPTTGFIRTSPEPMRKALMALDNDRS